MTNSKFSAIIPFMGNQFECMPCKSDCPVNQLCDDIKKLEPAAREAVVVHVSKVLERVARIREIRVTRNK